VLRRSASALYSALSPAERDWRTIPSIRSNIRITSDRYRRSGGSWVALASRSNRATRKGLKPSAPSLCRLSYSRSFLLLSVSVCVHDR
jgi:hypothetical protein